MRKRFLPLAAVAALLWSSPLAGQTPDWLSRILSAAELPVSTAQARVEGTPSEVISTALDVLIGARVPAGEAHEVIDEERAARRENGPVDNFGAFVQSQVAAGLRGRDLAAAIRAEHAARGKGPGARGQGGAAGDRGGKGGVGNPNGHGNARGGRDGEHGAAASKTRGGPPAAHSASDSNEHPTARRGAEGGRGSAAKGKPANRPRHQNR
ncbi:MAG TPA: hypothetical protein VIR34_03135 [Gemmatimonadaceae bacterium]|jgi:hypothetical protein